MKKFSKICLIIVLICVVAGGVCFGVSAAMVKRTAGGWDTIMKQFDEGFHVGPFYVEDGAFNFGSTQIEDQMTNDTDAYDDAATGSNDDINDLNDADDMNDIEDMDDADDMDDMEGFDHLDEDEGDSDEWNNDHYATAPSNANVLKLDGTEEKYVENDIVSLDVDIKAGEVQIEKSKDGFINFSLTGDRDFVYHTWLDDKGVLHCQDDTSKSVMNAFSSNDYAKLIISLPEELTWDDVDLSLNAGTMNIDTTIKAKNIDMEVNAGQLKATKLLTAENKMDVSVDLGEVSLNQIKTKELDGKCDLGRFSVSGEVTNGAQLETGMGELDLRLNGKEADYNYDAECGLGEININGKSIGGAGKKGKIDHDANKSIELKCGTGSIKVKTK